MGLSKQSTRAFERLRPELKILAQRVDGPAGKIAEVEIEFGADCFLFGLRLGGFGVWRDRDNGQLVVRFPATRRHRRLCVLLKTARAGADLDLRNAIVSTVIAMEEDRQIECVWQRLSSRSGVLKRLTIH